MSDPGFLKKHGFERPPRPFFSGNFSTGKDYVQADLTCHTCGTKIHIRFRGNPETMTEKGLKDWILHRAEKRHDCPAVKAVMQANTRKYYADILRGRDKLNDQEYREKLYGIDVDKFIRAGKGRA